MGPGTCFWCCGNINNLLWDLNLSIPWVFSWRMYLWLPSNTVRIRWILNPSERRTVAGLCIPFSSLLRMRVYKEEKESAGSSLVLAAGKICYTIEPDCERRHWRDIALISRKKSQLETAVCVVISSLLLVPPFTSLRVLLHILLDMCMCTTHIRLLIIRARAAGSFPRRDFVLRGI